MNLKSSSVNAHHGTRRRRFPVLVLAALWLPALDAQSILLIEHVTVIDGTGRPAKPDFCVLVEHGKIDKVAGCPMTAPSGARRIDGKGKFLIPGLMDVHVHLRGGGSPLESDNRAPNERVGIRALHSYIYSGVTTILDCGNNPDYIFKLRDMERGGQIISPRLLAVGGIVTYPGSHGGGPSATLVDSWPQHSRGLGQQERRRRLVGERQGNRKLFLRYRRASSGLAPRRGRWQGARPAVR